MSHPIHSTSARAIGRAAIHRLARENNAARAALAAYASEHLAKDFACLPAFHIDAARRPAASIGTAELRRLGFESDMTKVGGRARSSRLRAKGMSPPFVHSQNQRCRAKSKQQFLGLKTAYAIVILE
jgi:hypothetical protein